MKRMFFSLLVLFGSEGVGQTTLLSYSLLMRRTGAAKIDTANKNIFVWLNT